MQRRRCAHCQEVKPVGEFSWRNRSRGVLSPNCKTCQAESNQTHYQANKHLYKTRAEASKLKARQQRTQLLLEHFQANPCTDCGEADPVVLEFDHLRDKRFNIASDYCYRRWDVVLAEIAKCDVVCANCHRRRTSRRCGALRVLLTADATDQAAHGPPRASASATNGIDCSRAGPGGLV